MTEPLGHLIRKTKPVTLTFYDWHKTYPFRSTLYVRDEASDERCEQLVRAVQAVSQCILGDYAIGHRRYSVPGYAEALETIPTHVQGWQKWSIKYWTCLERGLGRARSLTIPGAHHELSLSARSAQYRTGKAGRNPDPQHPLWVEFVSLFTDLCVSSEGYPIDSHVELSYTATGWPPKGWKRRQ